MWLSSNPALRRIGEVRVSRTSIVFGAIGVATVLGDLSWHMFRDSWLFPIALTLIGIAIIYVGIWWSRNGADLGNRLRSLLPADLRELIESRRVLAVG